MKHYLSYMTCLAALLLSSCIRETIVDYPCHDAVLSFTISNSDDTRADGDGKSKGTNDKNYNEDAIKTVDIFLYKSEGYAPDVPAAKHISADVPADSKESCSVQASLTNEELEDLGLTGDGTSCKAYIVVNFSDIATKAKSTSYNDLTAAVIDSDFSKRQQFSTGVPAPSDPNEFIKLVSVMPQDSFVMDSGVETLSFSQNRLTSTAPVLVTRVAAKIRLTVSLADKVFTGPQGNGGLIWTPTFEGMTLSFHNGVNSATVAGGEAKNTEGNINFFNVTGIQFDSYSSGNATLTPIPGEYTDDGDASGSSYVPAPLATRAGADTRASITNITHVTPFYTYPSSWTSDLGEGAARFELKVSWGSVANSDGYYNANGEFIADHIGNPTDYIPYRYSIPINMAEKKIERNKYYHITINIGVLGNLDYFNPNEYSYYVTDWNSESVDVNLQKPQYLTVEKNYIEVYNQDTFGVAYKASDEIKAVITKVVKPNYTGNSAVEDNVIWKSATGSTSVAPDKVSVDEIIVDDRGNQTGKVTHTFGNTNPIEVEVKDGQVVLTHILENDMSSNDLDYVPYTITVLVTMKLANGQSITEEIVFKQYPAIYLFADPNSDFGNGGGVNDDHNTLVNGYYGGGGYTTSVSDATFVGPVSDEKSQVGYYGSVTGLFQSGGTNQNPNQYVITVSSISAGQSYVIGDPRVRTSDTELVNATNRVQTGGNNWNPTYTYYSAWATGYVVDENMNSVTPNRKLAHYYPTNVEMVSGKTDKTKPENFLTGWTIAPKFRIASSYAVVYGIEKMKQYDNAKKRCASYQENGYPAGRWRMPTYAEVAFIASMSDRLMIPRLFNDETNYWCAHGNFMPTDGEVSLDGDGSSATSIRCVYDEWYWGNKKLANPSRFTWGDTEITW